MNHTYFKHIYIIESFWQYFSQNLTSLVLIYWIFKFNLWYSFSNQVLQKKLDNLVPDQALLVTAFPGMYPFISRKAQSLTSIQIDVYVYSYVLRHSVAPSAFLKSFIGLRKRHVSSRLRFTLSCFLFFLLTASRFLHQCVYQNSK